MNSKTEQLEKNVVRLEIEVDVERFADGLQRAYKKNVGKYNVPGFRKGKAPKSLVERYYGESVFYEDAVNLLFPEVYEEAVTEHKLEPVARPEMDIKQIGKDKTLIFDVKVTVKPEVELGQYKGVEVPKNDATVTEEDIDKELARVAETQSRIITIDNRPIQDGDTAVIDFEGFVGDVAFQGGKGENYSLVIGSGQFIPGFEEQLIGVETGAELDVNVAFPEDYGSDELKGKSAVFKVKVNEVKMKEIPAIDDEFAKDASEFNTLEEYKADIRTRLTAEAEKKAAQKTENDVVTKVVENSTVEVPEVMIENHIDRLVQDFSWRLKYQGIEIDKYLEMTGMDMSKLREQMKERAEKEVRTQLVIEKLIETEKIEVSDEDVEAEIAKLAENYKQTPEEFKKQLQEDDMEYIRGGIKSKNAVAMLVANAVIV